MVDIDINHLAEALNDKADRDILNLTVSGYAKGSGLAMPSNRYIDLTLGASGTTYTAPSNGWFSIAKRSGNGGEYLSAANSNNDLIYEFDAYGPNNLCNVTIPVLKGNTIFINYNASGILHHFIFIYAEGEPSS